MPCCTDDGRVDEDEDCSVPPRWPRNRSIGGCADSSGGDTETVRNYSLQLHMVVPEMSCGMHCCCCRRWPRIHFRCRYGGDCCAAAVLLRCGGPFRSEAETTSRATTWRRTGALAAASNDLHLEDKKKGREELEICGLFTEKGRQLICRLERPL